jgi:hypothetical protein
LPQRIEELFNLNPPLTSERVNPSNEASRTNEGRNPNISFSHNT